MVTALPIHEYRLTPHAEFQMRRRGIGKELVHKVITTPEQVVVVRPGRVICQSRLKREGSEQRYLLRVIVDIDKFPAEVVTAYWTSKIEKYWRK